MINARTVHQTITYVNRSKVAAEVEECLRAEHDENGRRVGGRPRALRVDVLFAGIMLSFVENNNVHLTSVHRLLTTDLSRSLQVELGIRPSRHGAPITIRQIRYLMKRITRIYSNATTDDEARQALEDICNRLLREAGRNIEHSGSYAVDATALESFARGSRRHQKTGKKRAKKSDSEAGDWRTSITDDLPSTSRDNDADWGHRTKTYDNKTNMIFGYHLTTMVRVPKLSEAAAGVPFLVDHMFVLPANANGVPETVRAFAEAQEAGLTIDEILADRLYTNSTVDRWAQPLADLGISHTLDLHPQQHGAVAHPDGYLMIDGAPYHLDTPEHLHVIPRPQKLTVPDHPPAGATQQERFEHQRAKDALDRFTTLIAERERYALERFQNPREGRGARYRCGGKTGRVICDCTLNAEFINDPTIPRVRAGRNADGSLRKACFQKTFTVNNEHFRRFGQELRWGSPEWIRSYNRRSRVEGVYGILRNGINGTIKRGWTRLNGLVATSILLALALAITNLHALIRWHHDTGAAIDPLATIDTSDHGFEEYDAQGRLPAPNAPPTAV